MQVREVGDKEVDSEDPDDDDDDPQDSQIMEDRYREFDPQLDQKIAAIKRQVASLYISEFKEVKQLIKDKNSGDTKQ